MNLFMITEAILLITAIACSKQIKILSEAGGTENQINTLRSVKAFALLSIALSFVPLIIVSLTK